MVYPSNIKDVSFGVPQGSILGPLLFLVFFNDLSECVESALDIFADDTLLYHVIEVLNDCSILQHDLDSLQVCSIKNAMQFNAAKSEKRTITKKLTPVTGTYQLNNGEVPTTCTIKCLGVKIDSGLTFAEQTDHVASQMWKRQKVSCIAILCR